MASKTKLITNCVHNAKRLKHKSCQCHFPCTQADHVKATGKTQFKETGAWKPVPKHIVAASVTKRWTIIIEDSMKDVLKPKLCETVGMPCVSGQKVERPPRKAVDLGCVAWKAKAAADRLTLQARSAQAPKWDVANLQHQAED